MESGFGFFPLPHSPSFPGSKPVESAPVNPLSFILLCLADWINQEQQDTINCLQEAIKVLKEILGKKPRFTDRQRRRLAVKTKKIRFRYLKEIANLASPRTLRIWFRILAGNKYDSTNHHSSGRPPTKEKICDLAVLMAKENEITKGFKAR